MVVAFASHLAAFAAFLALAGLFLVTERQGTAARLLLAATAASALWAGAVAAAAWVSAPGVAFLVSAAELARTLTWILLVGWLVSQRLDWFGRRLQRIAIACLAAIVAVALAADLPGHGLPESGSTVGIVARLVLAVLGLVLLENILRTSSRDALWSLKHLLIGVGLIFGYDFYLFSDALLFNRPDPGLFAARGAVNAVVVPLIAIAATRNRDWSIEIHVSRQAVFHTATIVGSGLYLMGMAAAGYYLRRIGGEWGTLVQIAFFAAAIAIILVALFSEALRSWLRQVISRNFFSHRYDYRAEWLRFIDTLSSGEGRLHDRAVLAVADIVESPAGAIWVRRHDEDQLHPAAQWNLPADLPHVAVDSSLVRHLAATRSIVVLDDPEDGAAAAVPAWMRELRRAWLVVPCLHRDVVQGFILLTRPRAPRALHWEDASLLKTVGQQVASYLAEEEALRSLVDIHNLEEFNRRFAFVVHDVKNIVSQLSLMLRNAEKHRHNPEFQDDLMITVQHTVGKMQELLGQLRLERARGAEAMQGSGEAVTIEAVPVEPILSEIAAPWVEAGRRLPIDVAEAGLEVLADGRRLETVLRHLVQNAFEAVGDEGNVSMAARRRGGAVEISVVDDGPGMEADFVRDRLFQPLFTTKAGGSGLGMYQARRLLNEMEGKLEVVSTPGIGTTMRIVLADGGERLPALRTVGA